MSRHSVGVHSRARTSSRRWWVPTTVVHASGTATLERPETVAVVPTEPLKTPSHRRAEPTRAKARRAPRDDGAVWIISAALMIFAALLLGFVADVVFVSQVHEVRTQQVLLSDYRSDLANAVAPVGQTDSNGSLLAPGTPVAILAIPTLGVSQVVVEGTASGQTMDGPGHRRDTPLPGQPGISLVFGRQAAFGGPFGDLRSLRPGDPITVTTGQGEQKYAVMDVRREGDPMPQALAEGESRLTLVTADGTPYVPDGVLRVDAKLTSPVQPMPPRVLSAAALAPAEQAMAGDPGVWIGVVLWGQALLLAALALTWCRTRWGVWQAWVIGVPVLGFLGLAVANQLVQLLPNLM